MAVYPGKHFLVVAESWRSCGLCRDCGMCEAVCYYGVITRVERDGDWEYVVDGDKCPHHCDSKQAREE
ncbi:MAG: hypothetical protein ACYC6B_09220 [Thermoleophilia bacterium]